eukprot:1208265-Pleurochrysis_carterae.AAC.2
MHMNGAEADLIHKAKEQTREVPGTFAEYMVDCGIDTEQQTWGHIWKEFLVYAQQGDRGRSAKENASMDTRKEDVNNRDNTPHCTQGRWWGKMGTARNRCDTGGI